MQTSTITCQSLESGVHNLSLTTEEYDKLIQLQRDIFAKLTSYDNHQIILDKLCQLAEAMLPNSVASIMIKDATTQLLSVRAAPSVPAAGHDALANLKPSPTGGSCGNAVFHNQPQYVSDTKTDARWQDIRHIAYDFNLCACWSMPIRNKQEEAIGSFALSSFEHRAPSSFHQQLLEVCAFIVNIILEREKAENTLLEQQAHLNRVAFYDQLTGLPNRHKIYNDMERNPPIACAIINIDDFKEINDFFGIKAGDKILQEIASWLNKACRANAYRLGSDEFAILFYDKILTENVLKSRLLSLIASLNHELFMVDHEIINVRVTIGAAIHDDRILNRADIALHKAREQKVPIALYEARDNIEHKFRHNIAMTRRIRDAIAQDRIIAHFQPIVNFETNRVDKYETLLRMVDEQGQLVSPLDVIPIAKKTKLYPQLTRIIVSQACHTFTNRPECFSINLSIDDILDQETVDHISRTIQATNTGNRITFELLESEGIENYAAVNRFITTMKAQGARIAIDDFGTGYSNFEHLLRLNIDYIKIDGSLIKGINTDAKYKLIIETIVHFAKRINALTIAEFVSEQAIYDTVKALGVTYSQGFFTGKPDILS